MSSSALALTYHAATTTAEAWEFVLSCDRDLPADQRTVFTLRPMTVRERAAAERVGNRFNSAGDRHELVRRERARAVAVAVAHIVAVQNFPPEAPMPWPDTVEARATYLEQLHDDHVLEVARDVIGRSRVAPTDTRIMSLLYAEAHVDAARDVAGPDFYRCDVCTARGMRQLLGHDGPPTSFYSDNLLSHEPLERCPVRTLQLAADADPELTAELARHSTVYLPAYRDQHLLVAGGIADQPARYLDLMMIMHNLTAAVAAVVRKIRLETGE